MSTEEPDWGKHLCVGIEMLSGASARYDKKDGLFLFVDGRWVRGSGVTGSHREPLRDIRTVPRRKKRAPGEKRRAPTGRTGGTLLHQQIMHELRCVRWVVPCKCAEHTPFPRGFVLAALAGGPAQRLVTQLRRVLAERSLFYVTGEVHVVVDPRRRVGTAVDGVAAALDDPRRLWAIELKTGHRHVAPMTLTKHKAQTRAGMEGLQRLVGTEKDGRKVTGGLLIYLSGNVECVRVEEVRWDRDAIKRLRS